MRAATLVPALLMAMVMALIMALLGACSDEPKPPDAAPTSSPTGAATTTDPPAPLPPPPGDGCYRLEATELTEPTNQSTPVSCSRPHNAQTIHVGRLDLVVHGHAMRVDSARARRQVAESCPKQLDAYVGGTQQDRDLSRIRVVWFSPTLEEADGGARWYRCDLVVFGRDDSLHLQKGRVPRRVLADGGLDRFGLCGTAAPGSDGFRRVLCSLPHTWRAITTIALEGGDSYPGEDAVRQDGDSECQDQVRAAQDFALTFTYGWEWPTRAQWRAGQRFGYCWAESD